MSRLPSERIEVTAPMSYTGSLARLRRICRERAWAVPLVILLVAAAWLLVTAWYIVFGLLLVPYRLVRRGQRKRKLEAARHREMLAAQGAREIERERSA
jgi:hypothetical protein